MYKIILYHHRSGFETDFPTEASRTLWRDDQPNERILLSMNGKDSMTELPTFEFVIMPNHPLYDEIVHFKSIITVYRNDQIRFYGRVIGIGKDFYGQKSVQCEGALSFLLDSIPQLISKETSYTPRAFLTKLISEHNTQMASESYKHFTIGQITVDVADTSKKFKVESYAQTKSVIDDALIKDYKGYVRARLNNGTLYIDWLKDFNRTNNQPVKMAVNMLDRTIEENPEKYYTVLFPIGENKRTIESVNQGSKYLEDAAGIANYGRIIHPEVFNDAKTPAKLLEEARKKFDKRGTNMPLSVNVKAIDMYLLGQNVSELMVGDHLTNVEDNTGVLFTDITITEISWNPIEPQNDSFVLENQEAIDSKNESGNGTLSGRTSRIDRGLDENSKDLIKTYDNIMLTARENYELTADAIAEISRQHTITTETLLAQFDTGYAESYSEQSIHSVEIDGEKVYVQALVGTTTKQDPSGTATWVQEITGIRMEKHVDPDTGVETYTPVYKTDSLGNIIYDLVTGEAVYETIEEARQDEVHIPLRSIARQTQDEFYQLVGTTDITRVLNVPTSASTAGMFDKTKQYHVGDYVWYMNNGVKELYIFSHDHLGEWNVADVNEVAMTTIQRMTGSNLWQSEESIAQIVGSIEVEESVPTAASTAGSFSAQKYYAAGDYVWYPSTSDSHKKLYRFTKAHQGAWALEDVESVQTKKVTIQEGSGLYAEEGGVSVGIWEEGLLNAGLIVESLNDGETSAKIKASVVDIKSTSGSGVTIGSDGTIRVVVNDLVNNINTNASLKIDAARIDLQSGAIIKAINGGGSGASELTISADKLELDGETIATMLSGQYVEVDTLYSEGIDCEGDADVWGTVRAESFILGMSGTGTDLADAIVAVEANSNPPAGKVGFNYTTAAGVTSSVNFNIATLLTPEWSGTTGNQTLAIISSRNNVEINRYTYSPIMRLYQGGTPLTTGFAAELVTYDQSSNATVRKRINGYMVSGTMPGTSTPCVNVCTNSDGTGVVATFPIPGQAPDDIVLSDYSVLGKTVTVDAVDSSSQVLFSKTLAVDNFYDQIHADGVTTGRGQMGISVTWSDNVATIAAAQSSVKNDTITVTSNSIITYDSTTHKYSVVSTALADGDVVYTAPGTLTNDQAYKDGITTGRGQMGVSLSIEDNVVSASSVQSATKSDSVTITAIPSIVYNSTTHQYTITASAKADNDVIYTSGGQGSGTQAYTDGVTVGRGQMGVSLTLDDNVVQAAVVQSNTKSDSLTITAVPSIVYNSTTHQYTITASAKAGDEVIYTSGGQGTGTQAYTDGQNSVNVSKGTWSNGGITFSPSAGTGSSASVQLSKGTETWNGNVCTFPILDSSSNTGLTCSVTAPSQVFSVSGNWSGGSYIVKDNHNTERLRTTLSSIVTNGTPTKSEISDTILSVPLKVLYDDGEDGDETGFSTSVSVNAMPIWNAAAATVSLPGNTSTDKSVFTFAGPYPDGNTYSYDYTLSVDSTYCYVRATASGNLKLRIPNSYSPVKLEGYTASDATGYFSNEGVYIKHPGTHYYIRSHGTGSDGSGAQVYLVVCLRAQNSAGSYFYHSNLDSMGSGVPIGQSSSTTIMKNQVLKGPVTSIYTEGYKEGYKNANAITYTAGWNGSGTYTVTAKRDGTTIATRSTSPTLRLNGNGSTNFSAELYSDTSSPVKQKSIPCYLIQDGNTVKACGKSDGTEVVGSITVSGSGGSATSIDLQVRSAQKTVPSVPSGGTRVSMTTLNSYISQYSGRSDGPWYIPIDATISGGTGTKRYYITLD